MRWRVGWRWCCAADAAIASRVLVSVPLRVVLVWRVVPSMRVLRAETGRGDVVDAAVSVADNRVGIAAPVLVVRWMMARHVYGHQHNHAHGGACGASVRAHSVCMPKCGTAELGIGAVPVLCV